MPPSRWRRSRGSWSGTTTCCAWPRPTSSTSTRGCRAPWPATAWWSSSTTWPCSTAPPRCCSPSWRAPGCPSSRPTPTSTPCPAPCSTTSPGHAGGWSSSSARSPTTPCWPWRPNTSATSCPPRRPPSCCGTPVATRSWCASCSPGPVRRPPPVPTGCDWAGCGRRPACIRWSASGWSDSTASHARSSSSSPWPVRCRRTPSPRWPSSGCCTTHTCARPPPPPRAPWRRSKPWCRRCCARG